MSSSSPTERFAAWLAGERGLQRIAALLGMLVVLVYVGMPAEELTFDNAFIIGQDIRLHTFSAEYLGRVFTNDYWWPTVASNLYRPLTTLSFVIEHSVLGFAMNPLGYQVINALLHWCCGILLFRLVRRLGFGEIAGLFVAGLFVIHPIATEVVANIVGRSDLFATLAVLGGLLCWLRIREEPEAARRTKWFLWMGVCGFLGMFSKESAVVLPALVAWSIVVQAFSKDGARGLREMFRVRENWIAGAVFVPSVALFFAARRHFSSVPGVNEVPFVDNPLVSAGFLEAKATAFAVWGMQLANYALPFGLSSDYSFNVIQTAALPLGNATALWAWATILLFAVLACALPILCRRSPSLAFALGAYFLCMLPTSNVLIHIGSIRADRFHYLPSAFLLIALVGAATGIWAWARRHQPRLRAPLAVAGLGWALCLLLLAHFRCYDWRSNFTLWSSVYAVAPESVKAVGSFSSERARLRADAESYWEAVGRLEDYIERTSRETQVPARKWAIMLHSDLGSYLVSLYDDLAARGGSEAEKAALLQRAMHHFETGIRLEDENIALWRERWSEQVAPIEPRLELLHRNHATGLRRLGRDEEAVEVLRRAIGLSGFKIGPRVALFEALASLRRTEEAIKVWMVICLIEPNHREGVEVVGELIRSRHPESVPLQPDANGRPSLRLADRAVLGYLEQAMQAYAAELREAGFDLDAARLERSARVKYGFRPAGSG